MILRAAVCVVIAAAGCAGGDVTIRHDIAYDTRFPSDVLDLYLPDDGATQRPAVIIVHGGSWKMGGRSDHEDHAARLAASGYVVVNADYRLVPEGAYPAMMQDVACVFALTRARASEWGIDPDRIAVMGYSAGAHLVSLVAIAFDEVDFAPSCDGISPDNVRRPAAVISGSGPQDLRDWDDIKEVVGLLGKKADNPERYATASPITHVSPDAPPFLFLHGRDDLIVPVEQSRDMQAALAANGVEARLLEVAGGGHLVGSGTGSRQEVPVLSIDTPEAWLALNDFLADTVGRP
ncbi:hypothetical protein BH11MYX3_BH11MYX3_29920 [soil metagenome]